mmetsp:Transcript_29822/g.64423  ORF Transcript_29822/g.64423 Transcript_29822/m.64423 type:complete len:86 (-) Transcript_29822:578-835(-)
MFSFNCADVTASLAPNCGGSIPSRGFQRIAPASTPSHGRNGTDQRTEASLGGPLPGPLCFPHVCLAFTYSTEARLALFGRPKVAR